MQSNAQNELSGFGTRIGTDGKMTNASAGVETKLKKKAGMRWETQPWNCARKNPMANTITGCFSTRKIATRRLRTSLIATMKTNVSEKLTPNKKRHEGGPVRNATATLT